MNIITSEVIPFFITTKISLANFVGFLWLMVIKVAFPSTSWDADL